MRILVQPALIQQESLLWNYLLRCNGREPTPNELAEIRRKRLDHERRRDWLAVCSARRHDDELTADRIHGVERQLEALAARQDANDRDLDEMATAIVGIERRLR